MSQLQQLKDDIKQSMKDGQREITTTLRSIMSVAQGLAKDKNVEITDQHVVDAATKCKKEAVESMDIYRNLEGKVAEDNFYKAFRLDTWSQKYLPEQMDVEQITSAIETIISELNASSMKDMGKVMGKFSSTHTKGSFDGSIVSKIVKEKLA